MSLKIDGDYMQLISPITLVFSRVFVRKHKNIS